MAVSKDRRLAYINSQIQENEFQKMQMEVVYRVAKRLKDDQRQEAATKDLVNIESAQDELEKIKREIEDEEDEE